MSKERDYKIGDVIEEFGDDGYWGQRLLKDGYLFETFDVEGQHTKYKIVDVLEPATDDEKIQMLHKILDVAIKINGGVIKRNGPGHPTVFYDYSGHVNMLYIKIYKHGWVSNGGSESESYDIDFDELTLYTAKKVYNELVEMWGDILKMEAVSK